MSADDRQKPTRLESVHAPAPLGHIPRDVKPSPGLSERLTAEQRAWHELPDWYRATTTIGYKVGEEPTSKEEMVRREIAEWNRYTPSGDPIADARDLRFLRHEGLEGGGMRLEIAAGKGIDALVSEVNVQIQALRANRPGNEVSLADHLRQYPNDREAPLRFHDRVDAEEAAYLRFVAAYERDATADVVSRKLS